MNLVLYKPSSTDQIPGLPGGHWQAVQLGNLESQLPKDGMKQNQKPSLSSDLACTCKYYGESLKGFTSKPIALPQVFLVSWGHVNGMGVTPLIIALWSGLELRHEHRGACLNVWSTFQCSIHSRLPGQWLAKVIVWDRGGGA